MTYDKRQKQIIECITFLSFINSFRYQVLHFLIISIVMLLAFHMIGWTCVITRTFQIPTTQRLLFDRANYRVLMSLILAIYLSPLVKLSILLEIARSWSEDWQHYKYDPDQSLFKSLKVIQETGREKHLKRPLAVFTYESSNWSAP